MSKCQFMQLHLLFTHSGLSVRHRLELSIGYAISYRDLQGLALHRAASSGLGSLPALSPSEIISKGLSKIPVKPRRCCSSQATFGLLWNQNPGANLCKFEKLRSYAEATQKQSLISTLVNEGLLLKKQRANA